MMMRGNALKEKSDLLATGVYSSNHPIIMQLDRLQSLWPRKCLEVALQGECCGERERDKRLS